MKKNLFLISVVALSLGACSNDTTLEQNTATELQPKEIGFNPLNQVPTRAAVEGTDFPTTYSMWVAAYQYGSPSGHDYFYDASTSSVLDYVPYNYSTSNIWVGTPKQYWPLSDATINFLAVTKESNVTPSFHSTSSFAQDVTVAMTDNSSTQHDLMYAVGQGSVTKTGNAVVVNDPDVDMEFKHALAWVDFYVKTADTYLDNKAIKLRGIKVNGSYSGGSLYLDNSANYNSNTTPSALTPVWSSRTPVAPVAIAVPNWSTNYITNVSTEVAKGLLVVPHATENSISSFTIEYTLNGIDYDFDYTPASLVLTAGNHYVYDITFTLTEIRVEATVTPWADNATEYIEIPAMAYGEDRSVSVSKDAQKLVFTISGLDGSKKIKVTKGDTAEDAQVASTVPTLDSVVAETASTQTVSINLSANTTSDKTMTVTIQEYETDGTSPAGDPTVITITQGH